MNGRGKAITTLTGAIVAGTMLLSTAVWAGTVPLVETFDDDPLGDTPPVVQTESWYEVLDNQWRVEADGTGRDYRAFSSMTSGAKWAWSFIDVPALPGNDFETQVSFEIRRYSHASGDDRKDQLDIGLLALEHSNQMYTAMYRIVDEHNPEQHQRLVLYGGAGDVLGISANSLVPQAGQELTYMLSLAGEYAVPGDPNSELTLHAELTDGLNTLMVDAADLTPLSGGGFGLRAVANSGSTTVPAIIEADFDDFSIVPEPAAITLLALGGLALLGKKRRS